MVTVQFSIKRPKLHNIETYNAQYIKSLTFLPPCAGIIVVITVQAVVGIRQQYHRKVTGLPPPPPGVLFPNVTRAVADDGIVECLKFLLNYGFYKFGVEVRPSKPAAVGVLAGTQM